MQRMFPPEKDTIMGNMKAENSELLSILMSYRHLFDDAVKYPDWVLHEVASTAQSDKFIFPCDIIELRRILQTNEIAWSSRIVLFARQFAEKHLRLYPVFVVIDTSKIKDTYQDHNSARVYDTHLLDVQDGIMQVVINEPLNQNMKARALKIVLEENKEIPYYVSNGIPGLSAPNPKLAHVMGARLYEVNIDSLGIHTQVNAADPVEAVKKVLGRKWNNINKDKGMAVPAQFRVEYWVNTPFWDNIVKEANSFNRKKIAGVEKMTTQINLAPKEEQIFGFLVDAKKKLGINTEMRVAGGWVRDKLLGLPSDDIDIALLNMTGKQFVEAIRQHPMAPQVLDKDYTVDANPDQSKHLETAGIKIYGQKVEFVNLRSETYTDSRIPEMQMGTPEIDASRRDLTINSLFYNIETRQVEDYVGGMKDLQTLTLRTPLDPTQTFMDDPLRVLRMLRFHSRFNGSRLDPGAIQAMSRPDVQQAYMEKVSTERAGPEIMKMMAGRSPDKAVAILFDTDMYKAVFNLGQWSNLSPQGIKMDQRTQFHKHNLMVHTLEVMKNLNAMMLQNDEPIEMRMLGNLAALFHDFGKMDETIQTPHPNRPGQMQYLGHEDRSEDMAEEIMKSIGIGDGHRKFVRKIIGLHMRPMNAKEWSNKSIGKFLRDTLIPGQEDFSKDLWKYVMYHVKADTMASTHGDNPAEVAKQDANITRFQNFLSNQGTAQPSQMHKPLIDGNRIMQLIPEVKPSTGFIREIQDMLLDEQYEETVKTPAEAEAKVMEVKPYILDKYQRKGIQSMNWYSLQKRAYEVPSDNVQGPQIEKDPEVTYMKREAVFPFREGDKVRKRRALGMKQMFGVVRSIRNNIMLVEWDNGQKTKFDIRRPEIFDSLIERTG